MKLSNDPFTRKVQIGDRVAAAVFIVTATALAIGYIWDRLL